VGERLSVKTSLAILASSITSVIRCILQSVVVSHKSSGITVKILHDIT
jgi:hypothetical protein